MAALDDRLPQVDKFVKQKDASVPRVGSQSLEQIVTKAQGGVKRRSYLLKIHGPRRTGLRPKEAHFTSQEGTPTKFPFAKARERGDGTKHPTRPCETLYPHEGNLAKQH
jgi:hypothetical protein